MQQAIATLKLLCVPVLVGLLHVSLQFLGLTGVERDVFTLERAQNSFVVQTAVSLLLTMAIGAPYFRWSLRRQREGYGVWLSGWLLVYALQLLFNLAVLVLARHWLPLASLLFSIVSVSSLWWGLFYAGE